MQNSYTTSFPLAENPISERGNWINGGTVGLDWKNVRTTPGLAFGTESGSGGFEDSTAVLVGNWNPNQMAQAVAHTVNQNSNVIEEVELRLRTTIAAHSVTGREINFRCTSDGSQYVQIVRWNGPLGQFTYVSILSGDPGLHDGDVIKATIIGSTITAYINGTMVLQGTESTYTSGNRTALDPAGVRSTPTGSEICRGVQPDTVTGRDGTVGVLFSLWCGWAHLRSCVDQIAGSAVWTHGIR